MIAFKCLCFVLLSGVLAIACARDARPEHVSADDCTDKLGALLTQLRQSPRASEDDRRALLELELRCRGANADDASLIAKVETDLAVAARKYFSGTRSQPEYSTLLADRRAKLDKARSDARFRALLHAGDDDSDLVPDAIDRCAATPPGMPTDEDGCEFRCVPFDAMRSTKVDREQCAKYAASDPEDQGTRDLTLPYNPACDGVSPSSGSTPLGWHPGVLATAGTTSPTDVVRGFKLFAVRSGDTPGPCEKFYQFDLRFQTASGVVSTSLLFSEREDVSPKYRDIVTFVLPATLLASPSGPAPGAPTVVPLPAGRGIARDGFNSTVAVFWRLRVVNGIGVASGWSEYRYDEHGPDLTP